MSENSGYPKVGDIKEYTTTLNTGDLYMDGTTGDFYTLPYTTSDRLGNDVDFFKSYDWRIRNYEIKKIKENEDMRYLYEVILVNPKNEQFFECKVIARSETSALMEAYNKIPVMFGKNTKFDDLKTSCRILMEWKKEKSLTKAIETIKEAVE